MLWCKFSLPANQHIFPFNIDCMVYARKPIALLLDRANFESDESIWQLSVYKYGKKTTK